MDNAVYLTLALALAGTIYLSVKAVVALRRVGLVRFSKAAGAFVIELSAAGWKLLSGARATTVSSPHAEPLDFSGTGGRYNARTGNYDNGQDPYGIYPEDQSRGS